MDKIIVSVFIVLCLNILTNCTSVKTDNTPIQREWMLVSFDGFTKDQFIKNKARINLTAPVEGKKVKGSAFMGCNTMFFTSEFKNNGKVKISGFGSTMMACRNMDLETNFAATFEKMIRYSVDGHFLTVSDDDGHQMKFVASDWD